MFRAASDDDIEEYSDSVTCFIRKCIEDVIPTKTIRIYPNQKPWINSDVRSALDGIPGRVLKACAYQLAGVFTDIFNLSLSVCGSLMLQKIHHCAHT